MTLNNRHRRLPKVWRTAYHSQLDHVKDLLRNVYIVLVDTSPKAMESSFDFAEDMTFPDGTEAAIQAAGMFSSFVKLLSLTLVIGWLSMGPGDALFARPLHGSGLECDDMIQVWMAPRYVPYEYSLIVE